MPPLRTTVLAALIGCAPWAVMAQQAAPAVARILAEEIGSDGDPEAFLALAGQYRHVPA